MSRGPHDLRFRFAAYGGFWGALGASLAWLLYFAVQKPANVVMAAAVGAEVPEEDRVAILARRGELVRADVARALPGDVALVVRRTARDAAVDRRAPRLESDRFGWAAVVRKGPEQKICAKGEVVAAGGGHGESVSAANGAVVDADCAAADPANVAAGSAATCLGDCEGVWLSNRV